MKTLKQIRTIAENAEKVLDQARKNYLRNPHWNAELDLVEAHQNHKTAQYNLGFAVSQAKDGRQAATDDHNAKLDATRFDTRKGSQLVSTFVQNGVFYSRLYVNNGETACLQHAQHKTRKGRDRWTERTLQS